MESGKFDRLVRQAAAGASRRSVMRAGIGALAGSALATLGLRGDDAEAKKKKKRICDCTSSDAASCTGRRMKKKKANRTLRDNPCAYEGDCQAGISGCPAPQCVAPRPVTCGAGCCPAEFSKCCQDVGNPVFTSYCAPTSYTCCPVSAGGGACPPDRPTCCPITEDAPYGAGCCPANSACCSSDDDCTVEGETCSIDGCCIAEVNGEGRGRSRRFFEPAR